MNFVTYALQIGMAMQVWPSMPAMLYDYHREQWLKYLGVKPR